MPFIPDAQGKFVADNSSTVNTIPQDNSAENINILKDIASNPIANKDVLSKAAIDTGSTILNSLTNLGNNTINAIKNIPQIPNAAFNAIAHPILTGKAIGGAIGNKINEYTNENTRANKISTDPFGFGSDVINTALLAKGAISASQSQAGKQLLNTIQSNTINPIKQQINRIIQPNPSDLINKAQKLTTEILQPSKSELANALERGKQLPAIEQATKVIKQSPDYQTLNKNLDTSINDIFTKRNEILKSNNYPITQDYMKPLETLIKDTQSSGQATAAELQQMNDVLTNEKAWYVKNGDKLFRLDGQVRKEFLQDKTQSLLTKLQTGDIIDTQPARTQALNALRSGLKNAVEGGDAKVAAYNSTYNGLTRAKELVAGQQALEQKAVQQTALQKTIQMVTNPSQIPSIMARNAAEGRASSLLRNTGKIEKLMKKVKNNEVL